MFKYEHVFYLIQRLGKTSFPKHFAKISKTIDANVVNTFNGFHNGLSA